MAENQIGDSGGFTAQALQAIDIHKLLQTMVEKGASDLHLTASSPPCLRINGQIYALKTAALRPQDIQQIVYALLNDKQKRSFEEKNEIDFSFRWKGMSRFRANFFRQQGAIAAVLRQIPMKVPSLQELGLPGTLIPLLEKHQGLILVTGATGSGKSTTLAACIDHINVHDRGHIITVEDPIEFVHQHKCCIVNQREVGSDTESFASALRYILRQDPDVVLLGEIRDLETMEAALKIAETGHLAMATLHTNGAVQTIHRVLDFFPSRQQDMVRTQLSFILQAIVTQQLLPRADGMGRVMCCELLVPNAAIRNLIRDDKTHQIYSQMQMGQGRSGMNTMNQSLLSLLKSFQVTQEMALAASPDPEELATMIANEAKAQAAQKRSGY